jgi:hypothetical protein
MSGAAQLARLRRERANLLSRIAPGRPGVSALRARLAQVTLALLAAEVERSRLISRPGEKA